MGDPRQQLKSALTDLYFVFHAQGALAWTGLWALHQNDWGHDWAMISTSRSEILIPDYGLFTGNVLEHLDKRGILVCGDLRSFIDKFDKILRKYGIAINTFIEGNIKDGAIPEANAQVYIRGPREAGHDPLDLTISGIIGADTFMALRMREFGGKKDDWQHNIQSMHREWRMRGKLNEKSLSNLPPPGQEDRTPLPKPTKKGGFK